MSDSIKSADIYGDGIFAIINGGQMAREDVTSRNTHIAVGWKKQDEEQIAAAFVQYGRGKYDSDIEGVNADGSVSMVGVGGYFWQNLKDDLFVEGGVSVGQVRRDYNGTGFDTVIAETAHGKENSTYYGGNVKFGKKWHVAEITDSEPLIWELKGEYSAYVRYGFGHVGGYSTRLSSGEQFCADGVNMHSIGIGGRYEWVQKDFNRAYVDLSLNQGFGGKVRGTVNGLDAGTVNLNGLTAALNIGWKQYLTDRSTVDVSLSGFAGARRGFAANVTYSLAF